MPLSYRIPGLWLFRWVLLAALVQGAAASESLDRLRITITTASDWTALRLIGAERIVASSATPLTNTASYQAASDSLRVTQPLASAQAGQSVAVQFDVLLQSTNPPFIWFESTRGNIGRTWVDFYNFNTNPPVLVARVTNAVTSGHPNARLFPVQAASLLSGALGWPRPTLPPLVLAFYYPWYGFDSWASPTLADQPAQPSSSDSTITIAHHLHLAKRAGIDGFISSWWGPGSSTDLNLQRLLSLADTNCVVSIYFETLTGDPAVARPEADILNWLRYFLQTYGSHPRLLRHDGRPVIFIWAAGAAPADMWERVFTTLRAEGLDALYSANTLNAAYLDVFDGLHSYGPALSGSLDTDYPNASIACRTYGWLDDAPRLKIWAATAQPGYDDRLIPGRAGAFVDRLAGATYRRTLDTSLASAPDWVLITSFNEWWENTHIEPSLNYGDLHLNLTAQYADRFKGARPRPVADFQVPAVSQADGRVWLAWNAPFALAPGGYNLYRSPVSFSKTAGLTPLAAALTGRSFADYPPGEGRFHYAVAPIFAGAEGPLSEVLACQVSTNKVRANPGRAIPVDVALYVDSVGWISSAQAQSVANGLIAQLGPRLGRIEKVSAANLPAWLLSHIGNGQLDVLVTFGDIPASVYPSGNIEPDRSLAEAFLDDGNLVLNTGDYLFYGGGRNGSGGLMTVMDAAVKLTGDNIAMHTTPDAARFTPSLLDFTSDRPMRLTNLLHPQWSFELRLADNGGGWADPAIIRHARTGGRIGIVYQEQNDALPRTQVLSELFTNWLPTVARPAASAAALVPAGSVWRYLDTGANLGIVWRAPAFNDSAWPSGPAMLGFGDANGVFPVTTLASNRQITTYFRRTFVVSNPAEVVGLKALLQRDDGAVVYLNGTEVWRDNLTANVSITSSTPALTAISGSAETAWLTTNLNPALLRTGTNHLAVEIHQNDAASSDVLFDFALEASLSPPPTVALAAPTAESVLLPGPVTMTAAASGPVMRFEFFVDGVKAGETTDGSSSLTWPDAVPGDHTIQVRATDIYGRAATSAGVPVTIAQLLPLPLIPRDAVWRYDDSGMDWGEAWRSNHFQDAAWKSGPAKLGFGSDGEVTTLSRTGAGGGTNITFYFRRAFFLPEAASLSQLSARLVRDDGAVVYLNGAEIWRDNLPVTGPVTNATPANSAIGGGGETNWLTKTLSGSLLQAGTNLIAVEIHQSSSTSSDVGFNFELTATAALAHPPTLTLAPATGAWMLSWPGDPGLFTVFTATNLAAPIPWTRATNAPAFLNDRWVVALPSPTNGHRFYRLHSP